jgi:Beta-carotene isomerase D27-like, C-terminal
MAIQFSLASFQQYRCGGTKRWRIAWRKWLLCILTIFLQTNSDFAFLLPSTSRARLRHRRLYPICFVSSKPSTIVGTDPTTKPDYNNIVGPLGRFVDQLCLTVFRNQLRDQVLLGLAEENATVASARKNAVLADPAYYGPANFTQIVTLAAAMNALYSDPQRIQFRAQAVLCHLFPSWLPAQFQILFSRPFPIFSAQLNARVTAVLGVWLMGECIVNDIVRENDEDASMGRRQGVLVIRCRFLEESQCASVCVNSCKLPTQNFFLQHMGIPLLMEPNYTDGSCQFSFGRSPNVTTEAVATSTPCLVRCPTAGSHRRQHQNMTRLSSDACSMMGH